MLHLTVYILNRSIYYALFNWHKIHSIMCGIHRSLKSREITNNITNNTTNNTTNNSRNV